MMKRSGFKTRSGIKRVRKLPSGLIDSQVPNLTMKECDTFFSRKIRERDPICVYCIYTKQKNKKHSTECSHFHRRNIMALRYDLRNCDGLCRTHHNFLEFKKDTFYLQFKIAQFGKETVEELDRLAWTKESFYDARNKLFGIFDYLGGKTDV